MNFFFRIFVLATIIIAIFSTTTSGAKKEKRSRVKRGVSDKINPPLSITEAQLTQLLQIAKDQYDKANFANASSTLRHILKEVPRFEDIYPYAINAEMQSNNMSGAIELAVQGATRFPNNAMLNFYSCQSTTEALSNHLDYGHIQLPSKEEIYKHCSRAAKLEPNNPDIIQIYAFALKLLQRYDESILNYEYWLKNLASSQEMLRVQNLKSNFARTLMRAGNFEYAFKIVDEMLETNRDFESVQTASLVRAIGSPMDKKGWELLGELLNITASTIEMNANGTLCEPDEENGSTAGKWRIITNVTKFALENPDKVNVTPINVDMRYATYGTELDPVFVGPNLTQYPKVYSEKAINLVHYIGPTFISGHPGLPHANCNLYTGSHERNIDLQIFPLNDREMQFVEVADPAFSIVQHQSVNYYHWMAEVVPKLLIIRDMILAHPENYKNFKILVPSTTTWTRAISDTLKMKEFSNLADRYVSYDSPGSNRYYFPSGLVRIEWLRPENDTYGTLSTAWSVYWPPRAAYKLTRSFFHAALRERDLFPTPDNESETIVYVSRMGHIRTFPNEEEVRNALKERFGHKLRIHTGGEPLLEQVAIFSKARVIFGNHGAGLTNYMFTPKGARLVIIPSSPHIDFCFGNLVAALGGRHYVLSDIPGASYYGDFKAVTKSGMRAITDTIQRAYDDAVEDMSVNSHDEL